MLRNPGPKHGKNGAFASRKSAISAIFFLPVSAPARQGPGLSGANGKCSGAFCCAMMSGLSLRAWWDRPLGRNIDTIALGGTCGAMIRAVTPGSHEPVKHRDERSECRSAIFNMRANGQRLNRDDSLAVLAIML